MNTPINNLRRRRRQAGFTLIEVLGVILLLVAILTIAINSKWLIDKGLTKIDEIALNSRNSTVEAFVMNDLAAGSPLAVEQMVGPGKPFKEIPTSVKTREPLISSGVVPGEGEVYFSLPYTPTP